MRPAWLAVATLLATLATAYGILSGHVTPGSVPTFAILGWLGILATCGFIVYIVTLADEAGKDHQP